MNLNQSILVGFNIRSNEDYDFVSKYTSGAIIGSAFIKHISDSKDLEEDVSTFVRSIR